MGTRRTARVASDQLINMATVDKVSDGVKLTAIKDALDRAGLKPSTTVELEVGTKPYERIVGGMATMSKAESRSRRGIPDADRHPQPPALGLTGAAGPSSGSATSARAASTSIAVCEKRCSYFLLARAMD